MGKTFNERSVPQKYRRELKLLKKKKPSENDRWSYYKELKMYHIPSADIRNNKKQSRKDFNKLKVLIELLTLFY